MKPGAMLWLDVESSGLDPTRHALLEVGVIATNMRGETFSPEDEGLNFVIENDWRALVKDAPTAVLAMHAKSGLWQELEHGLPLDVVDEKLCAYVRSHDPESTYDWRICGSSPRLDLSMTEKYLPRLWRVVHYRFFDMTGFAWVLAANGLIACDGRTYESNHRALDDIRRSLNGYRFALEQLVAAKG